MSTMGRDGKSPFLKNPINYKIQGKNLVEISHKLRIYRGFKLMSKPWVEKLSMFLTLLKKEKSKEKWIKFAW